MIGCLSWKVQGPKSEGAANNTLVLANGQLAWHFDWIDGRLRSDYFENKLSGKRPGNKRPSRKALAWLTDRANTQARPSSIRCSPCRPGLGVRTVRQPR